MKQGVKIGQMIWAPAMVKQYLEQTNNHFEAFNRDAIKARGAGRIDDPTWKNYVSFFKGWKRYFYDNQNPWSAGHVDLAKDFRTDLREWRNRIGRIKGVKLSSQKLPKRDSEPFMSALEKVGTGAMVLAGVAFMWWMATMRRGGRAT